MKLNEFKKQLIQMQQIFAELPSIVQKLQRLRSTIDAFENHQLPPLPLLSLELSPDYILAHIQKYPQLMNLTSFLEDFRQLMITNFGIWHIFNQLWLNDLQDFCGLTSHNLEVMAGNALITSFLKNTVATDNLRWQGQDNELPQPWTNVIQLDALKAVKKYYSKVDNIIMAWAPDNSDIDYHLLQFLRKVHYQGNFIVIGEQNGVTDSKIFWQNAKLTLNDQLNQHHHSFDFIKDKVWLVK